MKKKYRTEKKNANQQPINVLNKVEPSLIYINQTTKNINSLEKCYLPPDNNEIKILHIIFTRFLLEPQLWNNSDNKIYNTEYIQNGFNVMKKYLLPSLENQMCKQFFWILTLGNKANISYIKSSLDLNYSFQTIIMYQKNFKNFIRKLSRDFDILITTRIDYDDRIYYDAVNDVRKAININKPVLIYGYLKGAYYFEEDNKYYEFYEHYHNQGALGIFISLITVLNKVNDTYIISDLGVHSIVKKNLFKSYKKFGIKEINYEPSVFESGSAKFVYIRQKYSTAYHRSMLIKNNLKEYDFNLSKFYGK